MLNRFCFLLLFAIAFSACQKETSLANGHVWIRFANKTLEPITDAYIVDGNISIGSISAASTTDYMMLDSFHVAYDLPFEVLEGAISGEPFVAYYGGFCGTGLVVETLPPGEYTLELLPTSPDVFNGLERYLHLKFQD